MQHLGLVSLLFVLSGLAIMAYRWPVKSDLTWSQNAARRLDSSILYGAALIVFLALLSWFTYDWLIPHRGLPMAFGVVFALGAIAQFVAAIVPETRGWRVPVHVASAYFMSLCLLFLVPIAFLSLPTIHPLTIILGWVTAAFMVWCWCFRIISRGTHRRTLLLQSLYLAGFFAFFLSLTYLG